MSTVDGLETAARLAQEPSRAAQFAEGVHQGMANWLAMTEAIRGPLKLEAALRRPLTPGEPGAQPGNAGDVFYEDASLNYLGISQGHILGGTLAALGDFERLCLNVGGAGFSHMMFRALPFDRFLAILETAIGDPMKQQLFAAIFQEAIDRVDPATYAPMVLAAPLPGSPADRRVLLQTGLGDRQVPNLGSFLHARLLGVPLLSPSPVGVFGLPSREGPITGSALALYDFGIDLIGAYAEASPSGDDNEVHEGLRRLEAAQAQMDDFFRPDSVIRNACAGPCDPE
jgi:hypothetical protein